MKAAAHRLRALCNLVVAVYGPANRAAFSFVKAMEAIEHLEQDLTTQAKRDLPGYPTNDLYFDDTAAPRAAPTAGPEPDTFDSAELAAAFLVGTVVDAAGDDDIVEGPEDT